MPNLLKVGRASLLFSALLLCYPACLDSSAEEAASAPSPARDQSAEGAAKPRRIPVRVGRVVQEDVTQELNLTGTARPWDEFQVSSEIPGRVVRLHAEEGDWVEKGRLLVDLDREKRLLELESRKANLARMEVELEFARKRLARGRSLLAKGAISEAEVDTLEQAVQVAETMVRTATISIDAMQEEIKDTRIVAPASGRVSRRWISVGETVNPAAPLFTLIQIHPLKVVTEIPEAYLHQIRPQQEATLVFEAMSRDELTGTVHFIHPVANSQSGAFPTEIRLPNRGARIQPGMVARVRLSASTIRQALLAPLDALVDLNGQYFVYVVREGVAYRTPVVVETRIGDRAVVSGSVAAGDQVVTGGNQNLVDATPVEVVS